MRDCLSENTLIRMAAGELNARDCEQAMSHLDGCPRCQATWKELRRTWDWLGQATVTPPDRDLTAAVLARAADLPAGSNHWRSLARIAAVVALSAGLGTAAGWLARSNARHACVPPAISDEQIVEALGLDAMDAGTDLLTSLFEVDEIGQELDQEQAS